MERTPTKRATTAAGFALLPADMWGEVVAAQWRTIFGGSTSVHDSLPDVAALACSSRGAHDAGRRFIAGRREEFLALRERAALQCTRGQLHEAEGNFELYLYGCHILFGARDARTIAALDSLARLQLTMHRDGEGALYLVSETLGACRGEIHCDGAFDSLVWDCEPASAIGCAERTRCLLEISAADSFARLLTVQADKESARGAESFRDARVVQLLGHANLGLDAAALPSPPDVAALLDCWWRSVDSLLAAGMTTAAEVIARTLDGLGRRVLGASHPSTLHMSHLLIQALRCQARFDEVMPLAVEAEILWRARAVQLFQSDNDNDRPEHEAHDQLGNDRRDAAAQLLIATSTLLSLLEKQDSDGLQRHAEIRTRVMTWLGTVVAGTGAHEEARRLEEAMATAITSGVSGWRSEHAAAVGL